MGRGSSNQKILHIILFIHIITESVAERIVKRPTKCPTLEVIKLIFFFLIYLMSKNKLMYVYNIAGYTRSNFIVLKNLTAVNLESYSEYFLHFPFPFTNQISWF